MAVNPLREQIAKIAAETMKNRIPAQKGTVYKYDNTHNYAMVEIDNPFGAGTYLLEYVPVEVVGGLHIPGPFKGDEVWVEFTGGNLNMPKVTALADRRYKGTFRERKLKHTKKGAYLPNALSRRK
jgi:hypothetical protein